jgi:hypothetical protein
MNASDKLNPIIDAPLLCNSCGRQLETQRIHLMGHDMFRLASCPGRECQYNGEVLVYHPARWGAQSNGEISRFTLPYTKAWQRENMKFTGFSVGTNGPTDGCEEKK